MTRLPLIGRLLSLKAVILSMRVRHQNRVSYALSPMSFRSWVTVHRGETRKQQQPQPSRPTRSMFYIER